jgi:serine/threonine protein kinase/tetratricopeptide (TPR) repeat protein
MGETKGRGSAPTRTSDSGLDSFLHRVGQAPSVAIEPRILPERLLHYRLIEKIGEGGMGEVFRAEDLKLGRSVAIKLVTARALLGASARERLVREARAAAALQHPHIVSVYAIESAEGLDFIAMEYVEGETLHARLARGPLAPAQVFKVGAQVASALAAAHRAGIIHRDIKPANILLTPGGDAKVLDFGLAKAIVPIAEDALTREGVPLGTVAYMSPEQSRGEALDARTDIFSLGSVLYEAATGQAAFRGPSALSILHEIAAVEPPAPSAIRPELTASFDLLLSRALAKERARRYGSTAEIEAALRALATERSAAPTEVSSIAVLPLLDLSATRDQDYLCDGIAEELINALTHVDGLRVAARSTSFQLNSSGLDARAIGERLCVSSVLEGSVRKSGDRLRVTVQLVDVAGGFPRWSHRFDGSIEDVFAIEDEIASGVAEALRGILSAREKNALRRPGTTAEAYEYFLRGRQRVHVMTIESLDEAKRMFERAIEIDPGYAPAYAGLALADGWLYIWMDGSEATFEAADRASRKALELAPALSDSHMARGHVLTLRRAYAEAEHEFEEAIRLNPNSFEAYYVHARACFESGQIEKSVALFRRAAEVQPEDFQALILCAQSLAVLGRTEEARAARREGIRRAERQLELDPNNARALSLGAVALLSEGQRERALEWTRRALEGSRAEDPSVLHNAACNYAKAEMKEEALRCLEKTFGRGLGRRAWAEHDPDFDSLRDDPRFQDMMRKLR